MTLREVAEKIGRDYTQISKWELGKVAPRFDALLAYSRVFRVPLDWILYGDAAPADSAVAVPAVPAVSTGGGAISNAAIATAPGAMATTGAPAAPADTAAQGAQPLAAQPLEEMEARLAGMERRIAALEQSMLAVQSAVIRGAAGAGLGAGVLPGSPSAVVGGGAPGNALSGGDGAPGVPPSGGGDGATPSAGVEAEA